jgi:hypothetical protein
MKEIAFFIESILIKLFKIVLGFLKSDTFRKIIFSRNFGIYIVIILVISVAFREGIGGAVDDIKKDKDKISKIYNIVKEGKEAMRIAQEIKESSTPVKYVSTLESEHDSRLKIYITDKCDGVVSKRCMRYCGQKVSGSINAKNDKGTSFFNKDIEFIVGKKSLPFGLDQGILMSLSGCKNNIIIDESMNYMPTDAVNFIEDLLPKSNKKRVSFEFSEKSQDGLCIKNYKPIEIFFTKHGMGDVVACNSIAKINLSITDGNNKSLYDQKNKSFLIGGNDMPIGIEHIISYTRMGDRVKVIVDDEYLSSYKKSKSILSGKKLSKGIYILDMEIIDVSNA